MSELERRVLFIDDEDINRSRVAFLLSRKGYAVTALDGIFSFRDLVRDGGLQNFDAVITDLNLNSSENDGKDGLEIAKTIRVARPDMPVLLWSGSNKEMLNDKDRNLFVCILENKGGSNMVQEMDVALQKYFEKPSEPATPQRAVSKPYNL